MTADPREKALRDALRMIENGEPRSLVSRAQIVMEEEGLPPVTARDLASVIEEATASSAFLNALGMQVHKWDAAEPDEEWTRGTKPSTYERRDVICEQLGIDAAGARSLLSKRPLFHDETIVITAPWNRWYTPERAAERTYYWPRYRDYLLSVRNWSQQSVTSLDLTTSDIVERLTDPCRHDANQAKGLVVGYVQSGKTANFTGVIAKSIDAGYRLIIVMTGTIELLRIQTQRRIDMEMVGRQNILGDIPPEKAADAKVDYHDDEDWLGGRFLDLGPGPIPTEIIRLTQHRADYRDLANHFKVLKMERADPTLPLYRPENLFRAHARLAVVKKNATVLRKLVGNINANKKAFAEIPVLLIDDESDEASPNTVDPEKVKKALDEGKAVEERRAINKCIADLLHSMPRAQYIGYTATPFANVFTDPADPLGIFPKDYVIGLQRPPGYMGVEDFHDLGPDVASLATVATSNEQAFVRALEAPEDDLSLQDRELQTAIDMFVLTGAAKLYRASISNKLDFRHHTMLVHHTVRINDHRELAERIRLLWVNSEFTKPAGRIRLQGLYEADVMPVSLARTEEGVPALPSFSILSDFIPIAITRITENGLNPVIVVNGDRDIEQQHLDFDRSSIWRILVGGAKLSRGFTVQGLTVTYFRRATNMSASLTQMGRWFGFRPGYRDLVRLYIARKARFGRREIDLYEAFRGVALDESAFRSQLKQYAEWDGDRPRVLPSQIPPLVTQHLPWLRPVAANKMFNAVLEEQSVQPLTPTGYPNHVDHLKANLDIWRPTLAKARIRVELPQSSGGGAFGAYVGVVPASEFVHTIESTGFLDFYRARIITPVTTFYRRLIDEGMLDDFIVVVPQPDTDAVDIREVGSRRIVERERREGRAGNFGEITDPKHRSCISEFVTLGAPPVSALARHASPKRGAVLLYLAREKSPNFETTPPTLVQTDDPECGLVVAFSSYIPSSALAREPNLVRFRVHIEGEGATVDAPSNVN